MRTSVIPSDIQYIGWRLDRYWMQNWSSQMSVDTSQHNLVMSLMRCVNPSPIFYRAVTYDFGDWRNKDSLWDFSTGVHPNIIYNSPHNFSKQDIEMVKKYMAKFLKYFSDDRLKLRIGLSRFDKGCLDRDFEDKLIDYVIALESVLIKDAGSDLKLRFSLRGASLLGNSPDERSELFAILGKAYNARNSLVHGSSKTDLTRVDIKTLSYIAGRVILKMVDLSSLNENREKIIEALDNFSLSRKENESVDDFLSRTLS